MTELFQRYPPHVWYLCGYAAILIFALVSIWWKIDQGKQRWGTRTTYLLCITAVCGLFAFGYNALDGFTAERNWGLGVIALFGVAGLLFSMQVNSRNVSLLPLIFLLNAEGLLMLYRLSLASGHIVDTEFVKQILFTTLGLVLMFGTVYILKLIFLLDVHGNRLDVLGIGTLRVWSSRLLYPLLQLQRRFSYHIWLALTLLLLAIPLVLGADMRVSLGSFQVQPSEFVKITFVVYLTHHLARYRQNIGAWDEPILRRIGFLIPPLLTLALPFLGYVLQRDFGPLMLYSLLLICMFFVGTSRLLEAAVILVVFVTTIVLYNQFAPLINALVPKYASIIVDRINIWQNPWLYTRGEQLVRSLWAIKAAGLWGMGLGTGHPEFFPSEVQHDFIFTLIAHETGVLGGILVTVTYLVFCWQGIRIALSTKYDTSWNEDWAWLRLRLALGCTLILFFQAMINIGGVINFSLMTGITLPYVSYGGTSLLVSYILAGILSFCSLTKKELR
jgi:cell division protein FtsW (lipid II flippase)